MAMRDLIKGAVEEAMSEGTADDAEATDEDELEDSSASEEGTVEGTAADDTEADSEAQEEGTEDVPSEYFGIDLSGLEPKERLAIIEGFQKRDDYIGKLLREQSTEDTKGSTEEAEELPPISDEDILKELGIDPEDPYQEQAAKVALPLVRAQLQQQATLAQLIEMQELAEIDRSWRTSLNGLEKEFGALPKELDHEKVMEFAAENGIGNPADAYWRLVGPSRMALTEAMKKAEAERARAAKRSISTVKPRSTEAEDDAPLQGRNVKEATREVTKKLLADLGIG